MTKFSKLVILTICAMLLMTNVLIKAQDQCKTDVPNCATCDGTNLAKCTACKDGFYPDNADDIKTCTACSDTNCATCSDATTCTKYNKGYTVVEGKCVSNTACTSKVDYCLACDTKNPNICIKCKDEYYYDKDKKTCQNCSENCAKCSDATTCTECNKGYTVVDEKCVSSTACLIIVANCTSCNTTDPNKCLLCADKYILNATGYCEFDDSNDLTIYPITYFMTFACLLITLAFVASFA